MEAINSDERIKKTTQTEHCRSFLNILCRTPVLAIWGRSCRDVAGVTDASQPDVTAQAARAGLCPSAKAYHRGHQAIEKLQAWRYSRLSNIDRQFGRLLTYINASGWLLFEASFVFTFPSPFEDAACEQLFLYSSSPQWPFEPAILHILR